MAGHDNGPLLERINAWRKRYGVAASQFGVMALGQPSFVSRLERGVRPRQTTLDRLDVFLAGPPPGYSARRAAGVRKYRRTIERNRAAELAAAHHRQTDPFERARSFLIRRGFVVVKASVYRPGLDGYVFNHAIKTKDEIIALARRKGWEG